MARYIDADRLMESLINGLFPNEKIETPFDVLRAIEQTPTADVVEVVRCKDCVYWEGRGYDGRCEAYQNGLIRDYTNYDDFCSYGERRAIMNGGEEE